MRGLIVDDSRSMRELLRLIVSDLPDVVVVAAVETSEEAWKFLRERRADFMILDLELPGKSGLELLEHCQRFQPVPTIVLSARLADDAQLRREVMRLGATAALAKPDGVSMGHAELRAEVGALIKTLSQNKNKSSVVRTAVNQIIAIGASTGGVTAVQQVVEDICSADCPIVITQHMSATYTRRFAESIGKLARRDAYEAVSSTVLRNNCIYVAPGDRHMRFTQRDHRIEIVLGEDDPVSGHRPSVDAMFTSLSQLRGIEIFAVLLTGMGHDGAQGMLELHQRGVRTFAQDEGSSIVFGMARAAHALHAVDELLPLHEIGASVMRHVRKLTAQAS